MKPLIAVFAHPDDEAFGPAGSLALFAKERDVYVICATNGDAGQNFTDKTQELGEIRKEELLESAKILGIKKVFFLGYKDGSLCNNLYHEIAEKITKIVQNIKPDTLLTWDIRGGSGHLDHIAVSLITSFIFEKNGFLKELWYYATPEKFRQVMKTYFIYLPPGYKKSEISKTIDITPVWNQKVEAMHAHQSQIHDVKKILGYYTVLPKEENFIILKKKVNP